MKRIALLALFLIMGLAARAADPGTLVVAFQPQENPARLELNAKAMAGFLSKQLNMPVKVYVPTDYASVVEGLRQGHVHVAYFSSWPYLLAHKLAGADVIVAEERDGKTSYNSCYFVRADGPIKSLADARGKRVAFVDPIDTCGYVFPLARLVDDHLLAPKSDPKKFFSDVLFAEGYEPALKALVHGQVDIAACAEFAAARYLTPEEQKQIRVLTTQGPVPTHLVAAVHTLSPALRQRIKQALLALNDSRERTLLSSVYGAEHFQPVTHKAHVASLKHALQVTGLDYPLNHAEEDDDD